ncbi:MAG: hypothetical protein U0835_00205 [Isosphaeraceae bacterium]
MADPFAGFQEGLDSPANDAAAVTPSDSTPLANFARSLYIGTGGNVNLTTTNGQTALFKNLPSGSILPVRTSYVLATNTTAQDIVALW